MSTKRQIPAVVFSVAIHAAALVIMAMFQIAAGSTAQEFIIETVAIDEDREQEEFVQELDDQEVIAETLNVIAGSISTNVGGSNAALSQQTKIDHDNIIQDPNIQVNVGAENLPGLDTVGDDLGEAEVTGEVGAVVEGYGAALDRLTQELIRLMRSQRVLAVWLFDESESMKDDQADIQQRIHRVYEELKLVDSDGERVGITKKRAGGEILLTSINSFGTTFRTHTPKPTGDIRKILQAIDKIPVDRTGKENLCSAIMSAVNQFKGFASKRKVVFIVVSDESGDDGLLVEEALHQAKMIRAPIYLMGRESVFGSQYAYVRWRHPDTGHIHHLPIRRGPETPFAEQLQFDGFHKRSDAHMSGFGPYEQVRLCRDTGGIFFQLPHEQENLHDYDAKKYHMLDLREYLPSLSSRREYADELANRPFRMAIREVIVMLNPYDERYKNLDVPTGGHFWRIPARYFPQVNTRLERIKGTLDALTIAQMRLVAVAKLRGQEPSQRWRANYDLILAQLFAYRVRLFEYGIGLGQFAKAVPTRKFKNPKANAWSVGHGTDQLVMPTLEQEKFLKVSADQLKSAHQAALDRLAKVQTDHPNTPWDNRAKWELARKFGVSFREHYIPPPPPPRPKTAPTRPTPKPSPPPNL